MACAELRDVLRRRALYWLAQREQSEAELRRKLQRLLVSLKSKQAGGSTPSTPADAADEVDAGAESPLIDQLIEWLRERQYLSDRRFVENRLRTRQTRFGAQRIQSELAQHGLSLSAEERQQLAQTELARAHAVWLRKFGPKPSTEASNQAAQARFLAQRGFSGEVVRKVLRGQGAPEAEDPDSSEY